MTRSFNPHFILSLALALLLGACGSQPNPDTDVTIPATVLNEQEFAAVLTDFALAEGASNINVKNATSQRLDTVYAFNPLKDHGIRKGKYDSSVVFYAQHTELYKKVYENVLARLSDMQTSRDSLRADSASK